MPNLDRTGPKGEGEMTGRKLGNCIDDTTCCNGVRKRCCAAVDKEFSANRLKRNRRG